MKARGEDVLVPCSGELWYGSSGDEKRGGSRRGGSVSSLSTSPSAVDRFAAVVIGATSSETATAADIVVKKDPNVDANNRF